MKKHSSKEISSTSSKKVPLKFFILIFVLAVPFWGLGVVINLLYSRDMPLYPAVNLVWHISMAFIPMIVALILVYRENGLKNVKHLLIRPFDYERLKSRIWIIPIFFLFPFLMVLEYGLLKLSGAQLPDLIQPLILFIPVFFIIFFIAGIGEELGWTGYALDPLQNQFTAVGAAILLGLTSAALHLVPLIIDSHPSVWIIWHLAHMIPFRILLVWLYNSNNRSMFAVIAFHSTSNIGETIWPFYNVSGYDPFITTILLTITAALVTVLWGPKTLAQYRFSKEK